MDYIAHKHFVVIPPGTDKHINYLPGDVVDTFDTWSERAKRWHMAAGLVQKHASRVDIDKLIERRCHVLQQENARLREQLAMATSPVVPVVPVPQRRAEGFSELAGNIDVVPMLDTPPPGVPGTLAIADGTHPCPLCPKQFDNDKSLRAHKSRVHGGL